MRTNSQYKKIQWLILSSLMAGALTACPDAGTGQASFEVTGKSLGSSFVDGTSIQPAEAIVTNTSSIAGMPPQVSFNMTSDLEFSSIDSTIYACDPTSETVLVCTAKDGAKLEGQAQTNLKPVFDLVYKNVDAPTALQARTHLLNLPISINSAVLTAPVVLAASTVTAAASGFDLIIDKTVSRPFVVDGSGNGSGEFTITASLGSTPPPFPPYVKIQDPVLPAGYAYDWTVIYANNAIPAYPWNCVKTGPVAGPWGISCTLKPAFLSTYPYPPLVLPVKVTGLTNLSTQQNCPWLYPLLGDTVNNNNHLGPAPYAKPCTKYTPIKSDLAIAKTQIAPLTTPANSFYWGLPGQYQIIVTNNSGPALSTVTIQDALTNIPAGSVIAFTAASPITTSPGWTCTGTFPTLTCTYSGAPVAAGQSFPPLVLNVTLKPENPALAQGETNCASLVNGSPVGVPTPIAYSDANNQNNKSCIDSQNMALEPFDVAITKKHLNTSVTPGGMVNYALNVQNIGAGDAPGPIVVTDTLPAAFSSTPTPTWSVSPPTAATCTVAFPTITCTSSGSLPAGASFVININATTNANATGNITNTATVSSYLNSSDSNLQNNTSSDVLVLTPPINLHRAESVVQASNGDFIVVGSSDSLTQGKEFTVRRYAPDGTTILWTKVENFSANNDVAVDVALDNLDKNIVVVGYAGGPTTTNTQAVLMKYDPSGTAIAGFPKTVGTLTDANYDYFGSVAIDSRDRIVTGGFDGPETVQVGSRARFVVHRFLSSGAVDTTFGISPSASGRTETDVLAVLGHSQYLNGLDDVLIEERAATAATKGIYRIYAGGLIRYTPINISTFAITRYNQSGALDTTWGGVGAIETHITNGAIDTTPGDPAQASILYEMGLQTSGGITRLVATGTGCGPVDCAYGSEADRSCVVTRYDLAAGAIDTTFGSSGAANFGASNATGGKACTAMDVNKTTNEIAVSGSGYNTTTGADYMARKLGINGALGTININDNPNAYAALNPREDRSQGVIWTSATNVMTVGFSFDTTLLDEWVVKGY